MLTSSVQKTILRTNHMKSTTAKKLAVMKMLEASISQLWSRSKSPKARRRKRRPLKVASSRGLWVTLTRLAVIQGIASDKVSQVVDFQCTQILQALEWAPTLLKTQLAKRVQASQLWRTISWVALVHTIRKVSSSTTWKLSVSKSNNLRLVIDQSLKETDKTSKNKSKKVNNVIIQRESNMRKRSRLFRVIRIVLLRKPSLRWTN